MMKRTLSLVLVCLVTSPALADPPTDPAASERVTGKAARDKHQVRLEQGWIQVEEHLARRKLDQQALAAQKELDKAEGASEPQITNDGTVEYVYGEAVPTLYCRPLTTCDIALQQGERVVSFSIGTGRQNVWRVQLVASQTAPSQVYTPRPHIAVVPKRPGVNTTLMIWTDRRTYTVDLVAANRSMRRISFSYPEDDALRALQARNLADASHAEVVQEADGPFSPRPWEWNRHYSVKCKSRWRVCRRIRSWMKPEFVMDDGNVTQITMPEAALSRPRPVLHLVSPTGDLVQVQYSLHGRTYIVPQVFDTASLRLTHGTRRKHVMEFRIQREEG